MGSIFNRGTRTKPLCYTKFKDTDDKWKMVPTHQPTKPLAILELDAMEQRVKDGKAAVERPGDVLSFADLGAKWEATLTNRSAKDDKSRLKNHLLPAFAKKKLKDITTAAVLRWLDEQQAAKKVSEPTRRHTLNLLSRFFAWAIERGYATTNPVRQIPQGKRPRQSPRVDVPWLNDDQLVRTLISRLPEPINYLFYLGNQEWVPWTCRADRPTGRCVPWSDAPRTAGPRSRSSSARPG